MTLTTEVLREYKRRRRENPDTLGASTALLWARGSVKPLTFDWKGNSGQHVAVGRTTQDGFDIRIVVDYDTYPSQRVEQTDTNTGIRNREYGRRWTGDLYDVRNYEPYLAVESGTTVRELAPEYNRMGMARHVAWEVARESLQQEAEAYMAPDRAEYVVRVVASIDGTDLGESFTLGGVEVEDYHVEMAAEDAVTEAGLIDEAIEDAREQLAKLLGAASKIGLDTRVTV